MDAKAAAQIAEEFLVDHMNGEDFFNADGDPILVFQNLYAEGAGVHVTFSIEMGEDAADPQLEKLAKGAIDALRAAHPEIKLVAITHEIFAG